jgi:GT2 family glycosyltransferase
MRERGAEMATIVVSPRERFSVAVASLESIARHTAQPYELIYVDGNSPRPVQARLAEIAARNGYKVVRSDHYLPPNHARNLALPHVRTPYVVFIDNDVVVSPGWLWRLVDCAENTGAAIVSPLICQGHPLHQIVHCAGGDCGVREVPTTTGVTRRMFERIRHQGKKVADMTYHREPTRLAEFHCMLVRTAFLHDLGKLDEQLLNTREHIDLCMEAAARDGSIWFEPESVVTYLNDGWLKPSDLHYYMLRWGDDWECRSLTRITEKWNLSTDERAEGALGYRLRNIGLRRRYKLVHPVARALTLGIGRGQVQQLLEEAVAALDRRLNAALNERYRRRVSLGA